MEDFRGTAQIGVIFQRRLDLRLIADQQEFEAVVAAPRNRCALDHDAHALIAAHRVNGDTREGHRAFTWSLRA